MSLVDTFRERVARTLLGDRLERLEHENAAWLETYKERPWRFSGDMLDNLREYDPRLYDMLMHLRNYDQLSPSGDLAEPNERDRLLAVDEARFLQRYDVLTGHGIRLWTNFGFGQHVEVRPRDEAAREVWTEFWKSKRNRALLRERNLHKMSDIVLTDGEIFFAVFIGLDGRSTIRRVPTEQIKEIISHPEDADTALYYRREWTDDAGGAQVVYYVDWLAEPADLDLVREKLPSDARIAGQPGSPGGSSYTKVVLYHAAHNTLRRRGWPITVSAAGWSREHKKFRENRAAVARAVATYVDELKVKAGQRGVDAIKARLQSSLATGAGLENNPPPVAGSTFIHNEAVETARRNLTTGAGDAKDDGEALAWMANLGLGVFPHYAGMGDAYRLATATSMETPISRLWSRYQLWWADVWSDLVDLVLTAYEENTNVVFDDHEADVSTDALVSQDIDQIAELITSILDAMEKGGMDEDSGFRAVRRLVVMALQTLGVDEVDEIIDPDAELPSEQEPEPEPIVVPPGTLPPNGNPQPQSGSPPANGQSPPTPAREFAPGVLELAAVLVEVQTAEATALVETETSYGQSIRAAVRGLWNGSLSRFDFVDSMILTIRRNLTNAWYEGARSVGINAPDELSTAETDTLEAMIANEINFLFRFAGDIERQNKAAGGALTPLLERAGLWSNRYGDAQSRARLMASNDPKLKWVYGDTQHCATCNKLNGKVKRASQWAAAGISPRRPPNTALDCKGWKCQCTLDPTSDPLSKGPLPSVP